MRQTYLKPPKKDARHTELTLDLMIDGKKKGKKASLFSDGDVEAWIPHSQIKDMWHLTGQTHNVIIPEWVAKDKGLI